MLHRLVDAHVQPKIFTCSIMVQLYYAIDVVNLDVLHVYGLQNYIVMVWNWWEMFTIIERPCWFTIIEKPSLLMMVRDSSAVKCCLLLGRNKLCGKNDNFIFIKAQKCHLIYQGTKMSSY